MKAERAWLSWSQFSMLFGGGDPYRRENPSTATSRERHRARLACSSLAEMTRSARTAGERLSDELFQDLPSHARVVEEWRLEEEEPEESSVEPARAEPEPRSQPPEPPLPVSRPGSGFRRAGVAHLEGLDLAKPAGKKGA